MDDDRCEQSARSVLGTGISDKYSVSAPFYYSAEDEAWVMFEVVQLGRAGGGVMRDQKNQRFALSSDKSDPTARLGLA